MSDPAAERAFQDEIIAHLTAHGWLLGESSNYDRERAPYPEDVIGYFKDTQPDAWKRICTNHRTHPRIADEIGVAPRTQVMVQSHISMGATAEGLFLPAVCHWEASAPETGD